MQSGFAIVVAIGVVVTVCALVIDVDLGPIPLPLLGAAVTSFGCVGLVAVSLGATPVVAGLAASAFVVFVAAPLALKVARFLEESGGDEPPSTSALVGDVVKVIHASNDGTYIEVAASLDGLPIILTAENDEPVTVLSPGDEVLVLEVLAPRKVRVRSV